jgi:hypothetical protein
MSDDPITDAPRPADEQEAPAEERPPNDTDHRPSQAEGDRDDEQT